MNTKNIHALLAEMSGLQGSKERYVANKLLCCVLEIAKNDNSTTCRFDRSGYFWEKMDKALSEIGFIANRENEEEE
jgi:hypothetical protein